MTNSNTTSNIQNSYLIDELSIDDYKSTSDIFYSAQSAKATGYSNSYLNTNAYFTDDSNITRTISYTKLNGNEEVVFIKQCNILKMTRNKKHKIKFLKSFPFIHIFNIYFTDLSYIDSKDSKSIRHIFALESPTLLAKKFNIEYEKQLVKILQMMI